MKDEIKVRYEGLYTVANTVDGKCLDVENLFSCITNDIRNVILEAEYRQEVRYMVWQVEDDAKGLAYKVDNFIRELSWMSKELRDAAEYYKYTEDRISRELEKIVGFEDPQINRIVEQPNKAKMEKTQGPEFVFAALWAMDRLQNVCKPNHSIGSAIYALSLVKEYVLEQKGINAVNYENSDIESQRVSYQLASINQLHFMPAIQPDGISAEEIDKKADAYVKSLIERYLFQNDVNIYKSTVLASLIIKRQTAINQKNLFGLGSDIKNFGSCKNIKGVNSEIVKKLSDDFFYDPGDSVKFALEKQISILDKQIQEIGDLKYLVHDKHLRSIMIKRIDNYSNELLTATVQVYEKEVNNEIFKSKILTKLAVIKGVNTDYEHSRMESSLELERIREVFESKYQSEVDELVREYQKNIYKVDFET